MGCGNLKVNDKNTRYQGIWAIEIPLYIQIGIAKLTFPSNYNICRTIASQSIYYNSIYFVNESPHSCHTYHAFVGLPTGLFSSRELFYICFTVLSNYVHSRCSRYFPFLISATKSDSMSQFLFLSLVQTPFLTTLEFRVDK